MDAISESQGAGSQAISHDIKHIVLSPAEDTLIASTSTNQLYHISLSSAEFSRVGRFEVVVKQI